MLFYAVTKSRRSIKTKFDQTNNQINKDTKLSIIINGLVQLTTYNIITIKAKLMKTTKKLHSSAKTSLIFTNTRRHKI